MQKKGQSFEKHIPMRTCIATGVKKPKNELIRLVKMADGSVAIDLKGKERARGANLDMTIEAFDLAVKKKAIERALKLERNLTVEEIDKLRKDFLSAIEEKKFRADKKSVTIRVEKEELKKRLSAN